MSSIFRKAFWPTAIVAAMLMVLFALGSSARTTSAAVVTDPTPATGDICEIGGPSDMFEGQTTIYWAIVDDTDAGSLDVDLDNGNGTISPAGDADITSVFQAPDDDVSVNNTNTMIGVDLDDGWDADFLDDAAEDFNTFFPSYSADFPGNDAQLGGECGVAGTTDGVSVINVTCITAGRFEVTWFDGGDETDTLQQTVTCHGLPANATLTATPARVQIVPSEGDVSHSLIALNVVDRFGNPAGEFQSVEFSVDHGCVIDTSAFSAKVIHGPVGLPDAGDFADAADNYADAFDLFGSLNLNDPNTGFNIETSDFADHYFFGPVPNSETQIFNVDLHGPAPPAPASIAAAILHCDLSSVTPGTATVTARIDITGGPDIVRTIPVTVVGPPANVVVSVDNASPTCGGRVTITAKITDSVGQNVSDHTLAEAISNLGSVIGGNGAVANFEGLVTPISSSVGETFSGVVSFFLLTSDTQESHYEFVVTSGGSGALGDRLGGIFSTPPVSGFAAVDCKVASAPAVVGPNTGTGPLRAPNTGDAGLASTSGGSSLVLFGIAAAAVFALMGLGALKAVRR